MSLLSFVLAFRVQTVAPEAEAEAAAAEGIDGAENNNTDKRPGAARFHLFVYRISRTVLDKVPLEICGVRWDVTAPNRRAAVCFLAAGGGGGTGTGSQRRRRRRMILMCQQHV